ncbi:putative fucosyltransferase-like protein [Bienertia sinuspersici]
MGPGFYGARPRKTAVDAENSGNLRKKWSNLMPFFVALVVIAEIAFLGRLDMAKNAAMFNSWADSLLRESSSSSDAFLSASHVQEQEDDDCETWLAKEDAVIYSRDFDKDPVLVAGGDQEWNTCSVGCKFGHDPGRKPDAAFGWPQEHGTASVLRSMESAQYYAENNIANARGKGYDVIMTTSLSSDIDSYGGCHRNRDGRVDKVETLKRYKFSLAFENSNEEDYVTEKFFQSLVAGTIPVVVGAPNIQDFVPCPGSVLHIKELKDVDSVAKTMNYLAKNPVAYNQSLRWKYDGPHDSFKALVDMAAVHSSCRLCIYLATRIHENEEKSQGFKKRPCKCSRGSETIYHVYVRERGRFEMESIFLRNLTMEGLESAVLKKFSNLRHVPIWKPERPESIRGGDELKIYRIYPLGKTQREALYTFKFEGESDLRSHVENNPCSKFEVIFV